MLLLVAALFFSTLAGDAGAVPFFFDGGPSL